MKKESLSRLRLIYGILLTAACLLSGVCLMVACAGIYFSGGDDPFSAQAVAEAFAPIAVPVYLTLALILGGFVLDSFLPSQPGRQKAERNPAAILSRLLEKRDLDRGEPALKAQILALRKGRKRERVIGFLLFAVCSIGFLCYGANPANFHQSQINSSMAKAVAILLCCLAVPFGYALGAAYRSRRSLEQEILLVKQLPVTRQEAPAPKKERSLSWLRWSVLAVAVICLIYGFLAGGTADVLTKAVNICTECVGLG